MNVTAALLHIVEQAHSLARILESATRLIAERLRVDGCSAFLLDERGELFRSAAGASNASGMDDRADAEARLIAARVVAEGRVASARAETTSLLASPMLLRASLVGVVVVQSIGWREFPEEDVEGLATICARPGRPPAAAARKRRRTAE